MRDLQTEDLFPLRDSMFEGQAVKIPYDYTKLLISEYGTASLIKTKFSGYGPSGITLSGLARG